MKKYLLTIALLTCSVASVAADYYQFVSSNSLGKDIQTLNKKYKLGLKLSQDDSSDTTHFYETPKSSDCRLSVKTTKKGNIQSISVANDKKCHFNTTSPLIYRSNKVMRVKDILNQVKPNETYIKIGCFNCPSRIEILDELIVKKDGYLLSFEIEGYHTESHIALSKLLFNDYQENHHYAYMDRLAEAFLEYPELFQRDDVKKLLFKHFVNREIHTYTISQSD